jgi:dephospho-CoA kinase
MPKLLGITGTLGSGKSTVGEILESSGITVIDSDKIVHGLLKQPGAVRDAVLKRFGSTIANPDGTINRQALGKIVFCDPPARKDLESIIHPAVREVSQAQIAQHADESLIALLIPLLFEAGMQDMFDQIWCVDTAYDQLLERLQKRSNLSKEQVDQRLDAQMPQQQKNSLAHVVINNSGTMEQTRAQVVKLLGSLSTM